MQHPLPIEKAEQNSRKRERGNPAVNKPESPDLDVISTNIEGNRIKLTFLVHHEMRPQQGSQDWGKMVKSKARAEESPPALPPFQDPRIATIERLQDEYYGPGEGDPRVPMSSISLREHLVQVASRYSLNLLSTDRNGIRITDNPLWKKLHRSGNNLQFLHLVQHRIIPTIRKAIDQFLKVVGEKCLQPHVEKYGMLTKTNHRLIRQIREQLEKLEDLLEEFQTILQTREQLLTVLYLLFVTNDWTDKACRDRLQWGEKELQQTRRNINQELISIMTSIANIEEHFTDYIPWDEEQEALVATNDVRPREVFPLNKPNAAAVDIHRHSYKEALPLHKRKPLTPYPMANIEETKNLETPKRTSGPPGSGIYRALKGMLSGSREETLQTISETTEADAPKTVYEEAASLLEKVKSTLESLGEAAHTQLHEELKTAAKELRSLLTGSRRLRKVVDSTRNEQPVNIARLNSMAAQVSARGHLQRECGNNEFKMRELIENITAQLSVLEEAA